MRAGWKNRAEDRAYFAAKLAARKTPRLRSAEERMVTKAGEIVKRMGQINIGLGEIVDTYSNIEKEKWGDVQKFMQSIHQSFGKIAEVIGKMESHAADMKAASERMNMNLIAIYGAMPPERAWKDLQTMQQAVDAMLAGKDSHRTQS